MTLYAVYSLRGHLTAQNPVNCYYLCVEANGTSDHEERPALLKLVRKQVEDTIVVMGHLESKAGDNLNDNSTLIASHHALLASHYVSLERRAEFVAKHEQAMQDFDRKLKALIDILNRKQGCGQAQ